MWNIHPTEKWIEDVVQKMNEKQLKTETSKFVIAFFSSMDNDFVKYFKENKNQISSYSELIFHIYTLLIYDDNLIPDNEWRYKRSEFQSMGIPINSEPTLVFFSLERVRNQEYQPNFFAGFNIKFFDYSPAGLIIMYHRMRTQHGEIQSPPSDVAVVNEGYAEYLKYFNNGKY